MDLGIKWDFKLPPVSSYVLAKQQPTIWLWKASVDNARKKISYMICRVFSGGKWTINSGLGEIQLFLVRRGKRNIPRVPRKRTLWHNGQYFRKISQVNKINGFYCPFNASWWEVSKHDSKKMIPWWKKKLCFNIKTKFKMTGAALSRPFAMHTG